MATADGNGNSLGPKYSMDKLIMKNNFVSVYEVTSVEDG